MREIKFRAWVTDNKGRFIRWAYGTPELGDMGQLYMHEGVGKKQLCQRNTLGQLTGLKDKDGCDIYEGDVLLYNDTESEYVDVGVGGQGVKVAEQEVNSITFVEWRGGEFGIKANSKFGETLQHGHWYPLPYVLKEELEWVEVIGNIYENPELVSNEIPV